METINDNNYELWLLRYAEGELTAGEREAVEAWLEEHPDAAEELALYNEAPRLAKDESVRYVAARQQSQPLWPVVLHWSAAAAVVAALMVPVAWMSTVPGSAGGSPAIETFHGVSMVAAVQQDSIVEEIKTVAVEEMLVVRKPAHAMDVEEEPPFVAEAMPEEEAAEEELDVVEMEALPTAEEVTAPAVEYCDDLIAYGPAPDTVYTNSLIAYDDSRRPWTESLKEWASETKTAQWLRRRFKARESELMAMNFESEIDFLK